MSSTMADDRLDALERLALVQNDAVRLLVDHVRALALVSAALVGTLDDEGRAAVREVALASLGQGPDHDRAAALIAAFTRDPVAVLADQAALSADLSGSPGRLQ